MAWEVDSITVDGEPCLMFFCLLVAVVAHYPDVGHIFQSIFWNLGLVFEEIIFIAFSAKILVPIPCPTCLISFLSDLLQTY